MTAIAVERGRWGRKAASSVEDSRLIAARKRLQNYRSILGSLSSAQLKEVLSYDGPEVSGKPKPKQRAA